jgi:hypothetical protein
LLGRDKAVRIFDYLYGERYLRQHERIAGFVHEHLAPTVDDQIEDLIARLSLGCLLYDDRLRSALQSSALSLTK